MRLGNIARVPYFATAGGKVLGIADFTARFGFVPDGRLTYFGFAQAAAERLSATGRALAGTHRAVAEDVLATLAGGATGAVFQLAVEPAERGAPYEFVAAHPELVVALARELQAVRTAAVALGSALDVSVRYASEMNGRDGTIYAGDPKKFVASFRAFREIFARIAPDVRFSFSPAIRADLAPRDIGEYWPGDDAVDICGATWYVHGERQRVRGLAHFTEYARAMAARGKSLALDEFGGAEGHGSGGPGSRYVDNDRMLEAMIDRARTLADDGIAFDYATLFLDEKKYGVDATLRFLSSNSQR